MTGRHRRQGGQVIAIFALATALFLFALLAMVLDLSAEFAWTTRVAGAAQLAAQAGANTVNPAYLYSGGESGSPRDPGCSGNTRILDVCADEAVCRQVGDRSAGIPPSDRPGSGTSCRNSADGTSVHAEVVKVVALPLGLFGTTAVVRGSFDAAPVAGACAVAPAGPPAPCPR